MALYHSASGLCNTTFVFEHQVSSLIENIRKARHINENVSSWMYLFFFLCTFYAASSNAHNIMTPKKYDWTKSYSALLSYNFIQIDFFLLLHGTSFVATLKILLFTRVLFDCSAFYFISCAQNWLKMTCLGHEQQTRLNFWRKKTEE